MKVIDLYTIALSQLTYVLAIEAPIYITVPSSVAADTLVEASLDAEVHNDDTRWCHAFRVYLGTSYEEKAHYFYNSDCFLLHEQTLCSPAIEMGSGYVLFKNTTFTVTIPASVGPPGKHYVLMARILNTDGSYYGPSLESKVFELTEANGTWANYQKRGYTLWGDDGIACSSFACVKNCSDATGQQVIAGTNSTSISIYQNCANSCPNVNIAFDSSTYGGQPTTSLTKPSICSVQPSNTAQSTPAITGSGNIPTSTNTRTATAAAGTNTASPRVDIPAFILMSILSLAVALVIG